KAPAFSEALLDRFLVLVESKQITPLIIITKVDLLAEAEVEMIQMAKAKYEEVGYTVELANASAGEALPQIAKYFTGKTTAFIGQSGVGKSSLLNAIHPDLTLKTAEISTSLGRGKHTTRHVELIEINGGYVADTPGFSSLEFAELEATELASF